MTAQAPRLLSAMMLSVASLTSCSSSPAPATIHHEEVPLPQLADPWEPFNRSMWGFNDGLLRYVIAPVGHGYRVIFPRFARSGLGNFFDNLAFPKRFFSSLSQGLWGGAGREGGRFLLNTTVGIAGFFDVGDALDIQPSDEDFGQAFAAGGWEDTRYLILPFGGPGTARDSVGGILDLLLDLTTYLPGGGILRGLNSGSDDVLTYLPIADSTFDLYQVAKLVHRFDRAMESENYEHPMDDCEHCIAQETLQAVFLTYEDSQFPCGAEVERAEINQSSDGLPYSVWMQPGEAPLVYILPGLGGHRIARSTLGLAEVAYEAGFSVVTLSSTMNFEFIANASTTDLPGYAPDDALDIHHAIERIHDDLVDEYEGRITQRALMGMSLGGFHTLYVAAHEQRGDPALRPFDAYLAINPPVRLDYGIEQLDAYYNAPLSLPAGTREVFVDHVIRKALELGQGEIEPTVEIPFSEMEAQFLIGLSFRQTLMDIAVQTQLLREEGVRQHDAASAIPTLTHREIESLSFRDYFEEAVLPYYAVREPSITPDARGAAQLFSRCDARSLLPAIGSNSRVRIMTNRDDFLLAESDIEWLAESFGSRADLYEHGGHLGSLYMPEIQQQLVQTLKQALGSVTQRESHRPPPGS